MKKNNFIIKNYSPEFDSIRAIAVSLVVFFHFDLIFKSGFLGVDIFFVISGFLITKILEETSYNKNWILFFFNKRIRRIIPALFLSIFMVLILSIFILSPVHIERLSVSSIFSILGISNMFFFTETGYFDFHKNFKPLLHTWSLAVEIQLYIIWFIIFLFLIKNFRRYRYQIIIFILCLSLITSIIYSNRATSFFYFTGFRLYEFAFGALGYYIVNDSKKIFFSNYSFLTCIIVIFFVSIFFKSDLETLNQNYNSFQSLSVVIPTFIIILSIKNLSFTRKILNQYWLINLGKISYSLYLIHWPIYIFFFYSGRFEVILTYKILLILFSIFLAYISYNYVEIYFRKFSKNKNFLINNKYFFSSLLFFFVFLLTLSIYLSNFIIPSKNLLKYNQIVNNQFDKQSKLQSEYKNESTREEFFKNQNNLKNILVIGDSHGWDIFHTIKRIEQINKESNLQFYNIGFSTCFTVDIKENFFTKSIRKVFNTYDKKKICKNILNEEKLFQAISRADKIILGSRWHLNNDFKKIIAFFKDNTNAKIIFINRINSFFDPPTLFFKNGTEVNRVAFRKKQEITYKINKKMNNILSNMNIDYVDRSNFFCENESCTIYYKNKILFSDQDHLTEAGHIYQSRLFKKTNLLDLLFSEITYK